MYFLAKLHRIGDGPSIQLAPNWRPTKWLQIDATGVWSDFHESRTRSDNHNGFFAPSRPPSAMRVVVSHRGKIQAGPWLLPASSDDSSYGILPTNVRGYQRLPTREGLEPTLCVCSSSTPVLWGCNRGMIPDVSFQGIAGMWKSARLSGLRMSLNYHRAEWQMGSQPAGAPSAHPWMVWSRRLASSRPTILQSFSPNLQMEACVKPDECIHRSGLETSFQSPPCRPAPHLGGASTYFGYTAAFLFYNCLIGLKLKP